MLTPAALQSLQALAYLLYWYKSTCVTGTEVQILTPEALQSLQALASTFAGQVGIFCGKLHWWQLQASSVRPHTLVA